ncbi:hypothetical protein CERZMDRAFT_68377 [Cercospora zeae-maydis SCOH1-5]|uniref:DUF6594 domain-containing protein n=1 Tax=Cercospora zeae-maydis SCOH1-5 TaxID=717836 RepID=A0A6A6FDY0_9PEZI|nr:hypothetical protein CERZMDRAFT_68377 [Cercospora zeae-maydis SCOH1-5]
MSDYLPSIPRNFRQTQDSAYSGPEAGQRDYEVQRGPSDSNKQKGQEHDSRPQSRESEQEKPERHGISDEDIEQGLKYSPVNFGLPGLGQFIAQDPDQETFVFRKFEVLTAWSLLAKQNELVSLERELLSLQFQVTKDPIAVRSQTEWLRFEKRAANKDTIEHRIAHVTQKISQKLDEYHSALASASSVAHLKRPSSRVTDLLKTTVKQLKIQDDLMGDYMSEDRQHDIVALKTSADHDRVTMFLRDHWPTRWTKVCISTIMAGHTRHFEDKYVTQLSRAFSVMLAVLLLVGSILTLYYVTDDGIRLGLLMMYIVVFATGVALTTGAKRDSIFAATAAYAAVLIVFISGDLNNSSTTLSTAAQNAITEAVSRAVNETLQSINTTSI